MIKKGDKFLILRYSNGIYDCIKNHRAVLDNLGYCWFGKIGVAPAERALEEKLNPQNPLVVLYCQGDAFVCKLLDISTSKPNEGYPAYYQKFLYDRNINPKMYFKLGSLERVPKDVFSKCISLSSKRPIADTVSRSMASFFYGEYPLEDVVKPVVPSTPKKKMPKKIPKPKKNAAIDTRSCIYMDNRVCTNKRCISFGYECERPSFCAKQKPRVIEE